MRRQHPDWHIGWAIGAGYRFHCIAADSASDSATPGSPAMPLVDRIHSVPTRAWKQRPFASETVREIKALRREFRAERYDLCVDLQGAIRSAVIGRMAGAFDFAGPAVPHERPANWFYGTPIDTSAIHVVEQACQCLGAAIGEPLDPTEAPLIPLDDCAETWRDTLLARSLPARSNDHYAIIAPSAGWGAKQWPAERYGAVAAELARAGYAPLINATSSDDPLANAVAQASGGSATVVPCTVSQLISLTRQASLVIAGDTGPLHLVCIVAEDGSAPPALRADGPRSQRALGNARACPAPSFKPTRPQPPRRHRGGSASDHHRRGQRRGARTPERRTR